MRARFPHRSTGSGFQLIECLIYISVVIVILGVGYMAVGRSISNSLALRKSADDITRALNLGEIWREDIRRSHTVRPVSEEGVEMIFLEGKAMTNAYALENNELARWAGDGPWVTILTNVQSSSMRADKRGKVDAWRWELELKQRDRTARIRPLFTFTAVPGSVAK